MHEQTMSYLLFGAMGHHALAGRSTSLSLGYGGVMDQWRNEWMRGGMWVASETKGLKESTGSIIVCKGRVV